VKRPERRAPLALRVSVTDRCGLRCLHCMPAEGVERFEPSQILRYEEIARFVRLMAAHWRLTKVHVTGGEPLERRDIVECIRMLAAEDVGDLAMTTNGQRLAALAAPLKRAGLARANVSLLSLRPRTFREATGGGDLGPTLEGIGAACRAGLAPVKCNVVVLRGINDGEVSDLAQFGIARGLEVRFIELMPLGPAAGRHREWFVSSDEVLGRLRDRFRLQALGRPPRSSTRLYRATDADGNSGRIGVIPSWTQPFCADCNRLRLTAGGELVGCLARRSRTSLLALLRTGDELDESRILAKVRAVMGRKRVRRAFSRHRYMVKTGG